MSRSREVLEAAGRTIKRFPATITLTAAVAVGAWQKNAAFIQALTVQPVDSWGRWWPRAMPSYVAPAEITGDPAADKVIAVGQTGGLVGWHEKREGTARTARVVGLGQFLGCLATRFVAVAGMVPPEQMTVPDVGQSSVSFALLANIFADVMHGPRRWDKIGGALGMAALALAAAPITYAMDPSVTAVFAHMAGVGAGYLAARFWPQPEMQMYAPPDA